MLNERTPGDVQRGAEHYAQKFERDVQTARMLEREELARAIFIGWVSRVPSPAYINADATPMECAGWTFRYADLFLAQRDAVREEALRKATT